MLETKLCVPFKSKMGVGRQSISEHLTSTSPTAYLWHFSGWTAVCFTSGPSLCQQKEGNKEIPCYALQCFPIHAHGMRQNRAEAQHSRPNTSEYKRLQPVWEWVWMKELVHARVSHVYLCFQVGYFYLENPSAPMKPQTWKASRKQRDSRRS